MANDSQNYTETFSNENSSDSSYWSDYQERQFTKKRLQIRIFVQSMFRRLSKSERFFQKRVKFKPIPMHL